MGNHDQLYQVAVILMTAQDFSAELFYQIVVFSQPASSQLASSQPASSQLASSQSL